MSANQSPIIEDEEQMEAARQMDACQAIHQFLLEQNELAIQNGQKISIWSQMLQKPGDSEVFSVAN